jgi:hypothetical protein
MGQKSISWMSENSTSWPIEMVWRMTSVPPIHF